MVTKQRKQRASQKLKTLNVKSPIALSNDFVVVSREWFDAVMEDLQILAKVAAQHGEPLGKWEDLKRKLKEDGLL